jgi:hypothetical protein
MSARTIRSFVEMLGLLSRGRFAERLDEELTEAIQHLEALPEEKGSATITVEVTLNFQSGRLDIRPKVKAKLPEAKAFTDTPFWTHEGGLSVQHPNQIDMFGGPRDAADRERGRAADRA